MNTVVLQALLRHSIGYICHHSAIIQPQCKLLYIIIHPQHKLGSITGIYLQTTVHSHGHLHSCLRLSSRLICLAGLRWKTINPCAHSNSSHIKANCTRDMANHIPDFWYLANSGCNFTTLVVGNGNTVIYLVLGNTPLVLVPHLILVDCVLVIKINHTNVPTQTARTTGFSRSVSYSLVAELQEKTMRTALTGAGHVGQVRVSAVVAVPAHADGGRLWGGSAVGGALQAQPLSLTRLKRSWRAC